MQFIFDISKRIETLSNVSNHKVYGLSLIAEIGGYFRLFLEVFVNNLSNGIFGIEIPKYVDILNGLGTSFALHYTLGYRRNYLSQK